MFVARCQQLYLRSLMNHHIGIRLSVLFLNVYHSEEVIGDGISLKHDSKSYFYKIVCHCTPSRGFWSLKIYLKNVFVCFWTKHSLSKFVCKGTRKIKLDNSKNFECCTIEYKNFECCTIVFVLHKLQYLTKTIIYCWMCFSF